LTRPPPRIDLSAWGWALFEWGRNPYILLCIIYVFAPYVSSVVIGDPVRGQEIISRWHTIGGVLVALTAPFIGAASDRMGRRKPMLAAFVALMATFVFAQWWAVPGDGGLPLWGVGALIIFAGVMFAWTEVLHNSMLTSASHPAVLSQVSGLGLALGAAASVLLLLFVLYAFALPGQIDWPFLPAQPLFGLNAAAYEPSRIVAPLSAAWLVIFAAPLFLYTRDLTTTGERFLPALRHGVGNVVRTLAKLDAHRNVALFLVARMLYADGKAAILIFSGVYASGVMGWDLIEMLTFGVLLSIFAVFGGFVAGALDHAFGPKRAVAVELCATLLCMIFLVSMTPEHMLFFIAIEPDVPLWDGPVFPTAPELAYLAGSMAIAVSITAAYGSSRSLMARLAPVGMEGELFGLYALSSSATAWAGPLLVERFTSTFQSQQAGFASIALLLGAGLGLLLWVKPPPGYAPVARPAAAPAL